MIPSPIAGRLIRPTEHDRASSELGTYGREEWGSDVSWLMRRAERRTLGTTLRIWFRRRVKSREARPAADGRALAAVPEAAPVSLNTTSSCPHPVAQDLSFGGSARFRRCSLCGTVLISHEGRWWSLEPCESPIPEELIRG